MISSTDSSVEYPAAPGCPPPPRCARDRRAVEPAGPRAQRDLARRPAAVARLAHDRREHDALDRHAARRRRRPTAASSAPVRSKSSRASQVTASRPPAATCARASARPSSRWRASGSDSKSAANTRAGSTPSVKQPRSQQVRARRRVRVLEAARIRHEAHVERERGALGERDARLVEQPGHDLGRARGAGVDEVDRAEERVVVVVVDVDDAREPPGDLAGAVDAQRRAAVERDQRARGRVGGHAALDRVEPEERQLARERIVAVLIEHDVAAGRRQRAAEAEQRPERVAVGRGVRAHAHGPAVAQHLDHLGRGSRRVLARRLARSARRDRGW